jgi:hypothetical protein
MREKTFTPLHARLRRQKIDEWCITMMDIQPSVRTTIAFSIISMTYRFAMPIIASIMHIMRQIFTIGRYFLPDSPPLRNHAGAV